MRFAVARPGRLVALGAAALLAVSGCTSSGEDPEPTPTPSTSASAGTSTGLAAFYDQQVDWEGCGDGFDCARVTVPLDYANPDDGSLELEVVRLQARDARGSLLLNPGGPGGSGVEYARAARIVLTPDVVDAYDVVGFDPRGVVSSAPVDCIEDSELDAIFAADGTPDTPQEVAELEEISERFGPGCQSRSPEVAPFMDTESAARDMDIIRAVLGEERLDYLGKSYGTYLGAQYAELFPERVGRMVLDGVLPSSLDSDALTFGQAKAFDVALQRFVADCIEQEDCPLPRDVDAGVARIQQFLADLDATPIPGVGDRMLTEALATYAILSYLYFPPSDWDTLRFGLDAAFQGDGSVLMDMMDERIQRNPDGTFANNGNEAFYAVSCLDRPGVGGADHAAGLAEQWAAEAPVFGPYLAWGNLPCWQWPMGAGTAEAAGEPPVFTAPGSAPILVVSTTYDMATPHEWGVQVAGELENATLLTYDGDGHTAYTSGSSCIDEAVDAYLLDGTLPAEGTVCTADGAGSAGA
ncbi:MAG: alpha/beta hydrolase [Candidatus Nanopelagicales bacterium]|nr:alpha/beta hydrolase [Candidatus Nanopelagicales bacterium]